MPGIAFIIDALTGGWKKYVFGAIGIIGVATALYVLYLQRELAQMALDLAVERAAFVECQRVNKGNKEALDKIEQDAAVTIEELSLRLKRKSEEKAKVKVVREIVREKAKECVGVDPATRAVIDSLRGPGPNAN